MKSKNNNSFGAEELCAMKSARSPEMAKSSNDLI